MGAQVLDKLTGMAKSSAKGGFKLFIGVSISSVVTAVSLILVLNLLGNPDDYGIIITALIFPSMLSLFKDWGMNSAMIKFLAQYKSEKDQQHQKRYGFRSNVRIGYGYSPHFVVLFAGRFSCNKRL